MRNTEDVGFVVFIKYTITYSSPEWYKKMEDSARLEMYDFMLGWPCGQSVNMI